VNVLDDGLARGEYQWVLDADGALVPMPVATEDEATVRPQRRWWTRRSHPRR
jgi:hypothetical protein